MIPLLQQDGASHQVLVFETPPPQAETPPGGTRVTYLQAPRQRRFALLRWILQHRHEFDILHIHTHVDRLFLSYVAARLLGWKIIYSSTLADTMRELVGTYRPIFQPLAWSLFSVFNIFVGISPRLYSGNDLKPGKARLIPQGVSLPADSSRESREETRRSLSISPDDVVLLYLGSLCARKGVQFLVDGFVRLAAGRPELRLLLVGPILEREYGEEIFHAIRRNGLSSRVIHVDFDPSPMRFYAAADIFVFASTDEGFGNVLLEAMSHSLPVVSRYLDGVTEAFLEHGVNGFLFSRPAAFDECVLALVGDPDLRRQIGLKARESVRSKYRIQDIAEHYIQLYRELAGPGKHAPAPVTQWPEIPASACTLPMLKLRPVRPQPAQPMLLVVIDTESEFDWSKGVAADAGAVRSIERLPSAQQIFERFGIRPCYVLDYPVATSPSSSAIVRELAGRGAEIGAHLQPWTTPPFVEPVDNRHAFPGNLPPWLQRKKLAILCEAVAQAVGSRPLIFKAGRYGIGAAMLRLLEEMGFEVDLSIAPGFDYTQEGGPDFSNFGPGLSWFGAHRDLLEIPTTSGFMGPLRNSGPALWKAMARPGFRHMHMRGILDRTGLLSRVRLSPEGYSLRQMKQLSRALLARGSQCLTLSFHSSSLQPGFTPYCSTPADVDRLLAKVEAYLEFFRDELGGTVTSPLALRASLQSLRR